MIKLLGVGAVMAASMTIGLKNRRRLRDKVTELESLRWEVGRLRAKIRSCALDLEACFAESRFFSGASELMKSGVPVGEAVRRCGIRAPGLELFSAGLDAETAEGQLENIDAFITQLDRALVCSREESEKKGRLWVSLSALAGAAVCIMLL